MKNIRLSVFRHVFCNIFIVTILVVLFCATYTGGVLSAFSSSEKDPHYHGNLNSRKVSLMINVYQGTEFIEPIMDAFAALHFKATFFIGGSWAEKNPNTLVSMRDRGFEIGNHGYLHRDHKKLSAQQNREEIFVTHQLVKNLADVEMKLFAPPSGSFGLTALETAYNLGYKTIMWTRDTIDWRDHNAEVITSRATRNAKGGDLILMHPTKETLEALPGILNWFYVNGFIVTTVSDCLT